VAILSATLSFIVFFGFLISVCMIFLYSSELHLSHAGLVYILADFGANLLIWVARQEGSQYQNTGA
jgi:ABC-type transport system involved in multi-copper enzyme maturation permease subunit